MNDTIMNRSALILLVEDDQSMLNGMCDLIQASAMLQAVGIDYDIKTMTAGNGEDALEAMRQQTPDLIVSDIMMPVMDGYQFLKEVQANPAWLHIPFIFLTAKGDRKEILEGQLRGANLYITKPFISTELLELIKSQLDRSFHRQSVHQQNVSDLKRGILQILNHEFRTPLTYVTAYYEMMADSLTQLSDYQNFQEYLRGIQVGCIRLTKLIEDFILVIELRTGEVQSNFRQRAKPIANINCLAQATIREREGEAKQKGIQLHFAPAEVLPSVYGDEDCLLNIFGRVLSNAIKFTPRSLNSEKNIYVSTSVHEDELHVVFRDEGMGFPSNIQNQIFDLFFQHDRGLMEQQGAGTGLTIAKGLVELYDGRIETQSQKGAGSTFTIVLPAYTASSDRPKKEVNGAQSQRQATILVVEDEHNLLLGLQELLEISKNSKYEISVLTATNGQEGIQILHKHQPDLIISDIMMPIMDGLEFLRQVRQNVEWLQIPFIFLTAKGERHDVHRGLRSGVEAYITKPYDSDELLQMVTARLDHYFQLQGAMFQNFDALKRSILNLITPDFRLPLSAVQKYSETLSANLKDVQNDAELKESLHGIRDGSVRLTRLVEDFISLAELRTGETATAYAMREQPIHNPGFILHDVGQECMSMAEDAGIHLHWNTNADLSPIFGDNLTLLNGLHRLVEVSVRLRAGVEKQDIYLSTMQESNELHFSIGLPQNLSLDALEKVRALMAEDTPDLLQEPDYAPAVHIAQGYIALNNGRIQIKQDPDANYAFVVSLPVHTP
ncbi:MAG: response regulator [Chloroflexi bacterium]|nr:response regulator [Chloroflexota bacterium]